MPLTDAPDLIIITDQNFLLVEDLLKESKTAGYDFIQRTIDDWHSGANKFAQPGEKLWGLVTANSLIAIGGLNRDPYTTDGQTGRVRHLYVREAERRKGYASLLMEAVISEAQKYFIVLRLYTDNPAAAKFYENSGFTPVKAIKVSHVLNL